MKTYYLKQNINLFGNIFTVYDDENNKCMNVCGSRVLLIIDRIIGNYINVKYHLKAADLNNKHILSIYKNKGKIFKDFNIKSENLEFNIEQNKKLLAKPIIYIKQEDNLYTCKGDVMAREFYVLNKDKKICGSIYKKTFKISDYYEINIQENEIEELMISISIIIDCCFHN